VVTSRTGAHESAYFDGYGQEDDDEDVYVDDEEDEDSAYIKSKGVENPTKLMGVKQHHQLTKTGGRQSPGKFYSKQSAGSTPSPKKSASSPVNDLNKLVRLAQQQQQQHFQPGSPKSPATANQTVRYSFSPCADDNHVM
jgi:hypothetical protein